MTSLQSSCNRNKSSSSWFKCSLVSYLDNSLSTLLWTLETIILEKILLWFSHSIQVSSTAYSYPSFWHSFDCMHCSHTELYQFFSMTNHLKQAERDSHTKNMPTRILHDVYFHSPICSHIGIFFSVIVTENFKEITDRDIKHQWKNPKVDKTSFGKCKESKLYLFRAIETLIWKECRHFPCSHSCVFPDCIHFKRQIFVSQTNIFHST